MSVPVIHHPSYEVDIGPHVFLTAKYRLVRTRLLDEGTIHPEDIVEPESATDTDVARVHTREYLEKISGGGLSASEQLQLEVPFSQPLKAAMWRCAGGSITAGQLACERGLAVHLGGGFHHAFPDHGEGFCLIHDVAIAIRHLQADGAVSRAAVIDLDVHHGNGTAAIFADDPDVFTFSMHQEHNYPAWKPPGDLDIPLADATGDDEYLEQLNAHLPDIIARHRPQLAYYLAGADPYYEDQLGGLALTLEGLRRRDEIVLSQLRAAGVPTVVTLAGGYARDPDDTVTIHCNSVRTAAALAGDGE